jgi:hypothetical protein
MVRTVFGPMKKKQLYIHRLNELIDDGWFDSWRDTHEIVTEVNKGVPARWGQFHYAVVKRYIDRPNVMPLEEKWEKRTRFWKKI